VFHALRGQIKTSSSATFIHLEKPGSRFPDRLSFINSSFLQAKKCNSITVSTAKIKIFVHLFYFGEHVDIAITMA